MKILLCLTCALALAPAAPTESTIHSFANAPQGWNPFAPLLRDPAGNLYGTTNRGGTSNAGLVFKLDPAGHQRVLHSFLNGPDGAYPYAGVVADSAGNLYGTATFGGASNAGLVYKLDTTGAETILYTFNGAADGANPYAAVILDSAGNLYGTAYNGGVTSCPSGCGVVYKIDPAGHQTILYSFAGPDGAKPYAGLVADASGKLYGTTVSGGAQGDGTVFKLDASGHETVLHSFDWQTSPGGSQPYAGVVLDPAGNLYGTTSFGGGDIYKLDPAAHYTVLYHFNDAGAAQHPQGGVILDASGNLYGTTQQGGATGNGAVYSLARTGQFTLLYSFPGASSSTLGDPNPGLIRDAAGNLYGATPAGGVLGLVYKLDQSGHSKVVYNFEGGLGGTAPSSLLRTSRGTFYGTTAFGGLSNAGVVYKMNAAGTEQLLYSFTGAADGANPTGNIVRDAAGAIYGTAGGGAANQGVVFKVGPSGHETVLHTFSGSADGGLPTGVIRDTSGNLYGTATSGGIYGQGVVYELDTTGLLTVLHSFKGGNDGSFPGACVVRDSAGNLYGTTIAGGAGQQGTIYKVDPSGNESVLYSFTGAADGGGPTAGVILDSAGNIYGTTSGRSGGDGEVYRLDTTGHLTVLYAFTGAAGGVVRDHAGNLYGATQQGGSANCPNGCGVIYKVTPAGKETVLYAFQGGKSGSLPGPAFLRVGSDVFYGTATQGGPAAGGLIYELRGAGTPACRVDTHVHAKCP